MGTPRGEWLQQEAARLIAAGHSSQDVWRRLGPLGLPAPPPERSRIRREDVLAGAEFGNAGPSGLAGRLQRVDGELALFLCFHDEGSPLTALVEAWGSAPADYTVTWEFLENPATQKWRIRLALRSPVVAEVLLHAPVLRADEEARLGGLATRGGLLIVSTRGLEDALVGDDWVRTAESIDVAPRFRLAPSPELAGFVQRRGWSLDEVAAYVPPFPEERSTWTRRPPPPPPAPRPRPPRWDRRRSPATEAEVRAAEERLDVRLPGRYRDFLLRSGNQDEDDRRPAFLPPELVHWLRDGYLAELVEIYGHTEELAEELSGLLVLTDTDRNGTMFYALNPAVVTGAGEWEVWAHAHWIPGERRFGRLDDLLAWHDELGA